MAVCSPTCDRPHFSNAYLRRVVQRRNWRPTSTLPQAAKSMARTDNEELCEPLLAVWPRGRHLCLNTVTNATSPKKEEEKTEEEKKTRREEPNRNGNESWRSLKYCLRHRSRVLWLAPERVGPETHAVRRFHEGVEKGHLYEPELLVGLRLQWLR